jgi:hypothetical protein
MTLPASPSASNYDAASDDPAQARAQLKTLRDAVDSILTHLGLSTLTNSSGPAAPGGGLEVVAAVLQARANFRTITGADTIIASDRGKVLDCTASGFSLGATAAATLGDGFYCWVRNSASSGNVTIDPNASETIDGATTLIIPPGQMVFISCNAALFRTAGGKCWRQGTQLSKNPHAVSTTTAQAHNLPSVPQLLDVRLICLSSEGGYNAGDLADWGASNSGDVNNGAGAGFVTVQKDAANIALVLGDTRPYIVNKSTGAAFQITAANWRWTIDPYYFG